MDGLIRHLRRSLPDEVAGLVQQHLEHLEKGEYESILASTEGRELLRTSEGTEVSDSPASAKWNDGMFERLGSLLSDRSQPAKQVIYFCIGYAALLAFIQSNVTGPPLPFASAKLLLPDSVSSSPKKTKELRQALLANLGLDGIAAYKLTPNIELLCLADAVFTCPAVLKNVVVARWAKLRAHFMHQRLLSEPSSTLQTIIYDDLDMLAGQVLESPGESSFDVEARAEFILERSTIHLHHGLDKLAREDIQKASEDRQFKYSLTGLLGKRTKWQQKDTSQLVVLAKSADTQANSHANGSNGKAPGSNDPSKPENLDLNDDTLLESISFTQRPNDGTDSKSTDSLPAELSDLDPSSQPQLEPLDSSILLSLASSIKNTAPENGLTREETLPYATRVLDGGSSNWQVYTQALLVRSRIEGYKSRTVERGLLQLQALVDQVIADTTSEDTAVANGNSEATVPTFLPKAEGSENAPVTERLRYIFQLASPTRWELEAELASRWVSLGGLRSALGIYERLEMWAEAALCWAATEREDKAKAIVRRQLYHATKGGPDTPEDDVDEDEKWEGPLRDPAPLDAPRLYCILGDLDQSVEMWNKAWEVSGQRYARAQRSIGRFYLAAHDYVNAALAYSRSLNVNKLNVQSWFALGCTLLELEQYERAVESFTRCVQLDETDAEAWSNLAAALLRTEPESQTVVEEDKPKLDDEEEAPKDVPVDIKSAMQNKKLDALSALKRAAALKHDSFRIWDNVLTVAASLVPPDYATILSAQNRIIKLRGTIDGEKCIDVNIIQALVNHIIAASDSYDASQPGLVRLTVQFIDQAVIPLITASADLWRIVSKLALWRKKPSSALDAEEKAWRAVTSQPGWETESEKRWNEIVEATIRLSDSYESLGEMERTEGMGAGELVAKDWKFKARSAIRGIMNKGRDSWEGTEGWEKLKETTDSLRG